MTRRSRYRGAMLGLATGDALGTTVEFEPPGSFPPLTDIVGGGPFSLKPGQWTDDTSMALCLAESLIECNGFNPVHQLQTYCRWHRQGHWSSTGQCFDIGGTTWEALTGFERSGKGFSGPTEPYPFRFIKMGIFEESMRCLVWLLFTDPHQSHGRSRPCDWWGSVNSSQTKHRILSSKIPILINRTHTRPATAAS